MDLQSTGRDITERYVGGILDGYRAVGLARDPSDSLRKPFMVDLDIDGLWVTKRIFDELKPAVGHEYAEAWAIDRSPVSEGEHFVMTGVRVKPNGRYSSFIAYLNDPEDQSLVWYKDIYTDNATLNLPLDELLHVACYGAGTVNDGGTKLIWPILEITDGGPYAGKTVANGHIVKFDLSGNVEANVEIGEVRAFDLQMDVCRTSDGNLAIVSSKWSAETQANPPTWAGDIENYEVGCLDQFLDFGTLTPFDWQNNQDHFQYWSTDAYVAKLSGSDLSIIWETTFDENPGAPRECYPGNMKQQECMYKITEAADGGLVISGNNGDNFDDSYLAKIYPDCQAKIDYSYYHSNYPPDNNIDPQYTHTITGNVTWSVDMNVHGLVVVPNGARLTVTNGATISFADSEKLDERTYIHVEAGGKLSVISGAILTSLNACAGSMWDGILAGGNVLLSQDVFANQSHIGLYSSASIENARMGVLAANDYPASYSMADLLANSSGAIIVVNNFTFRNNVRDVVLSPYENHAPGNPQNIRVNRSKFRNGTFITDNVLNDPTLVPKTHVRLAGVRGLYFANCSWQNSTGGWPYSNIKDMGSGIHSENSTFSVTADCSSNQPYGVPCPEANVLRGSFSGLLYGIFATTFEMDRTFVVEQTDFTLNVAGIRMEGIQDAGITRCTFDVAEPVLEGWLSSPYGLYADQCTGYEIEENSFTTSVPQGGYQKVGLVLMGSGPQYNTFYNNTFDDLYVGSLLQGKNGLADGTVGLEVKCNDYGLVAKNAFDVALTGIMSYIQNMQGISVPIPTGPAGNRFSNHDVNDDPEADWFVENGSPDVNYFHHTPTAGNRTAPTQFDNTFLFPTDVMLLWPGKEDACPSNLSHEHERSEEKAKSENEDQEYVSSKTAYDATKDNGTTYSLVSYVSNSANNSTQVRNALQSVAPKASSEAFEAAFERAPAMNAWHITQALLSNSPLQTEVLKTMHNSGLPIFYTNLVESAQSGDVNILSLLQSQMAEHAGEKTEALTDLGRSSWLDSLALSTTLDSLELWHNYLLADNNALVASGIYNAQKDHSALETLASNEELNSQTPALFGVLKRYANSEQNNGWSTPSSNDLLWLEALAPERDSIGSAHASAWLAAMGTEQRDELILLPLEERSMAVQQNNMDHNKWQDGPFVEVYPNPSDGPVYVVFDVPEGVTEAELVIFDLNGRMIENISLNEGPGISELNFIEHTSGLYLIKIQLDGYTAATTKFILSN